MDHRILGNTHEKVSLLSLGGAALGSNPSNTFFGKTVSDAEAVETVHTALELGISLIDTSPFYGDSERKIGIALKEYGNRDSFLLCTKAGTHPQISGYSQDIFFRSIENSLNTLKSDYIDILHIHDPEPKDLDVAFSENGAIEAMLALREQGLVKYFSLGVRDHALHRKFIDSGLANVILPYLDYNLLRQDMTPLLDVCEDKGIGVLLGSGLCMGYLSGIDPRQISVPHFNIEKEIDPILAVRMYDWCAERGIDIKALNFQFILRHRGVSSILVSASSAKEVSENVNAIVKPVEHSQFEAFLSHFSLSGVT